MQMVQIPNFKTCHKKILYYTESNYYYYTILNHTILSRNQILLSQLFIHTEKAVYVLYHVDVYSSSTHLCCHAKKRSEWTVDVNWL